jgi:hypothetical protein
VSGFHSTELRLLHDFLKSKTISIFEMKIIYHIDIYEIKIYSFGECVFRKQKRHLKVP